MNAIYNELEQLAQAIAKRRPQNNFITGTRIGYGWVAQPEYEHVIRFSDVASHAVPGKEARANRGARAVSRRTPGPRL